jgi:diguanylate cyclase (GGDEF)-like protein
MSEYRNEGPGLRADGSETSPVSRPQDQPSAAASPDEATQRDEVRRFLNLLIIATLTGGLFDGIAAIVIDNPRWFLTVIVAAVLATWLAVVPRRAIDRKNIGAVVTRIAIVLTGAIVVVAFVQPFLALVLAPATLLPIALGLPYLAGRSLRHLMGSAWAAAVVMIIASLLPDAAVHSSAVVTIVQMWALTVVIGLVFFLLYRSAEGLKASGREFRRLFQLSSDLAETTDAGVLGELVARHLAEATGFDDCVIYALAADGGRLVPFGSHPVERSLEAAPEPLAKRPMLERVANDQAPIVIDVSDERADPLERDRLRVLGRRAMLLLPLSAHDKPVGIAELTSAAPHSIDVRRLALARTLTFEAAMAIENGRLYQELRDRSLHDPLTGLANRSLLYDRAEHALARQARKDGAGVAVLFMDIDDFKTINDTLGHARGDRLLTILGERLRTVARAADTVARLGGDEFALLLEDVSSADAALAVAARVIDALAPSFDLAGQPTRASASIGVAFRSAQGTSFDDLLKDADAAMYEAKAAGKGRTVLSAGGRIAQDLGRALPPAK